MSENYTETTTVLGVKVQLDHTEISLCDQFMTVVLTIWTEKD